MPEAWAKLLLHSGISAAEKKKNPQGVIKALEFYTATSSGIGGEGESKFMTAQRYGDGECEREGGRGRRERGRGGSMSESGGEEKAVVF